MAGPDEQEGKPVGTVYVAVAGPNTVRVLPLDLSGDRAAIQSGTVAAALSAAAEMISADSVPREDSSLG